MTETDLVSQLAGTRLLDLGAMHRLLLDRRLTSEDLVRRCLERIEAVNPTVNAVLTLDQSAPAMAAASDRRYVAGTPLSRLDGIPVLLKDNIDVAGLATTVGSWLLAGSPPLRDAEVVARLRSAGAVIVGKANLSEWGNFRSVFAVEGWSAVGGQTRNPYGLDRSPWGSSAGSAVAVATGMVPLAIGTEADGSIVCPAGVSGVVGVKPELGLLPRGGIAPVSDWLDTVGVLAARVSDAAVCLAVLAGDRAVPVGPSRLDGRRFGLWQVPDMPAEVDQIMVRTCDAVRRAGAAVELVDAGQLELSPDLLLDGWRALLAEFRPSIEGYLRSRPGVPSSLAELIDANRADPVELSDFGQDLFEQAAAISDQDRADAVGVRESVRRQARELIDGVLARHGFDGLLAPTNPPAWVIDGAAGDPLAASSSTPAALAGYPNVSVPAGFVDELPVGVSVFGPAETARTLALALAVEAALAESPDRVTVTSVIEVPERR